MTKTSLSYLAFIDIDTTLKPSLYKRLVWGLSFLIFILLLSFLPLSIVYKVLVGIAALVALWFGQVYSYHLLAISALESNDEGKNPSITNNELDFLDWQLQLVQGVIKVPWHAQQDIWQAKLDDIADMGWMVILKFHIVEPIQKKVSVAVWVDQVDSNTWRQLKVLAR